MLLRLQAFGHSHDVFWLKGGDKGTSDVEAKLVSPLSMQQPTPPVLVKGVCSLESTSEAGTQQINPPSALP